MKGKLIMADTVTAPVAQAPVPTATPTTTTAPTPAPVAKKEEKGPDTIGTIATTAPIKGKPAPEQGKKLYIVA